MILFLAAGMAAANVAEAQRLSLDIYQSCVLTKATEFRHSDLSGDPPSIVAYAAGVTCDSERSDLLEKTKAFLRERHPELKTGGIGKLIALFIAKQEAELEKQVEAQEIREANAQNK
jgi:hypothetical protein